MPPAVTVVGSVNLDLVVGVPHLPGRGETVVGTSTATGPGGKGANQAAAAGTLCTDVAMVGRVGDDSVGRRLVADLADRGVLTTAVLVTDGVPTGTATVAVEDGSGENLIVVAPGANGAVMPADVEIRAVHEADVLLMQLEIPLETVHAAARHASGLVVLNPAPPTKLPRDLLERVDVLVPNESELARLADVEPAERTPDELAALARRVTDRDVVVTIGARGAVVITESAVELVEPPKVDAVDTTGAGDCFCGALGVALARGDELPAAVRYAVTAAALSTTAVGARGLLPDDHAVRQAMRG
ncbi:MAG TPA: ribokinase [Jatrophihabitantaceae bacterium]|jgi:ribokinase|nr:ribokinase [Jatrophihabitantaceae bacterium]